MSSKKYPLTVIYGEQACNALDESSIETVKRKIKNGKLKGDYNVYSFDTREDRERAIEILHESIGWMKTRCETPESRIIEKLDYALYEKPIEEAQQIISKEFPKETVILEEKMENCYEPINHFLFTVGKNRVKVMYGRETGKCLAVHVL